MEDYANIHDQSHGIYNISLGRFSTISISLQNLTAAKKTITDLTLQVENECPWTKAAFNISGIGEGVVWKPVGALGADPRYWFKSKGKLHQNSHTESLASNKKMRNADAKTKAKAFAESAVTENRLRQGREYLTEMGFKREEREEMFLRWLCKDITEEEKLRLQEMKIDNNMLRNSIREIGKGWYAKKEGQPGS